MTLAEHTQALLDALETGDTTFSEEIGDLGLNQMEVYEAVELKGSEDGRSIALAHEFGSPALVFAFGLIVGAALNNER